MTEAQAPEGQQFPAPIKFEIQPPLTREIVQGHIAHARTLGLPELDCPSFGMFDTLHIVANGPSAVDAPRGEPFTLAVNGALKLFGKHGPTFWAGCDPQELMTSFLDDPPERTKYLVASKCHPKVFEALKDRDVKLWHVDDFNCGDDVRATPSAVSITATILLQMVRLGWRKIEVWGWDGCYLDDKDHAVSQDHVRVNDVTITVGDRDFKTTGSWAVEAQDCDRLMAILDLVGVDVTIHGDGMFSAIRKHRSHVSREAYLAAA